MENIVRRINLEGELGEKFGKVWHLNVKSPAEAVRAIDAQRKGFKKYFLDTEEKGIGYEVIVGDQGIQQEEGLLYPSPMRDDYTFVPIPQGGKSRAMGMIMMGAIIILSAGAAAGVFGATGLMAPGAAVTTAAGGMTSTITAVEGFTFMESMAFVAQGAVGSSMTQSALMMGAALMFGGVAALLAPTNDSAAGNEEQSYLFDGAVNSVKQGTPVPILYGRLIVGGATISASIKSNQETSRVKGTRRQFVYGVGGGPYFGGGTIHGGTAGCFIKGTMIEMADGTEKEISLIKLNEYTKGGRVDSTMQFLHQTIYDYKGVKVSGTHWVNEEGQFIEVENSKYGILTDQIELVYSLITSEHRIFINDIEFADYLQVSDEEWEPYYKLVKDNLNKEIRI